MAKKKRKKTTWATARLRAVQPLAIVVIGTTLLGFALVAHATPTKHTERSPKTVTVTSPTPKQESQSATTPKTSAAASAATSTPSTPQVKNTPAPVTHTTIPQGTKPEPVVTQQPCSGNRPDGKFYERQRNCALSASAHNNYRIYLYQLVGVYGYER
jgi:cytoskeletal protein RodZ